MKTFKFSGSPEALERWRQTIAGTILKEGTAISNKCHRPFFTVELSFVDTVRLTPEWASGWHEIILAHEV